ncbi:MAG: hypothetical protein AUK47_21475 [Deltaproteobacteria bacterium CG2_30_63_29]|nr:MAG: hypothetical protein AUK47_21475 [Deltaproteobacteria bacterium CG2_30_63_29]PJB44548.1 MAG: hypothetical protein CO108_08565 [Deltaproteobacteria bacterium CG_4_9_14_3_um_filter_63_12]
MSKKKDGANATPLVRFQRGMLLPADQVARLEALRALEDDITAQHKEAAARGYAEGLRRAATDSVGILVAADAAARQRVEQARDDVLALALRLAERILGQAVTAQPEALERLLRELLEGLPDGDTVEVIVGSKAFEVLSEGLLAVRLQCDEAAPPWSLRMLSIAGQVDAGFETQLANVERQLRR